MEQHDLSIPAAAESAMPIARRDVDHPRVMLAIDAATPYVNAAHVRADGPPFLFLSITGSLDLWSHDPEAFRRLATACLQAAAVLDEAVWSSAVLRDRVVAEARDLVERAQ